MRRRTLLLGAAGLPLCGCSVLNVIADAYGPPTTGDFIIVWQDNQDGRVKAKGYKSRGTGALFPTLQVDPTSSSPQRVPAVAAFLSGFVVAWVDLANFSVKVRGFKLDGTELFGVTVVDQNVGWDPPNPGQDNDPWMSPRVAVARDGSSFVVCWSRNASLTTRARRFTVSSTGATALTPFDVGPVGSLYPDIAMADDGTFAVVYTNLPGSFIRGFYPNDSFKFGSTAIKLGGSANLISNFGQSVAISRDGSRITVVQSTWPEPVHMAPVHAHGFDGMGNAIFSAVPAPSTLPSVIVTDRSFPSVAMYDDGRFFAVWQEDRNRNGVFNIRGRIFKPDGTPTGNDFVVNRNTAGQQRIPGIATNRAGGFVASWHDSATGNDDVRYRGFLGTDDHAEYIGEVTVNDALPGNQRFPRVAFVPAP